MVEFELSEDRGKEIARRMGLDESKAPKKIVFDPEFDKGERIRLCLKCGFVNVFMGQPWLCPVCDADQCSSFTKDQVDELIDELQEVYYRLNPEVGK